MEGERVRTTNLHAWSVLPSSLPPLPKTLDETKGHHPSLLQTTNHPQNDAPRRPSVTRRPFAGDRSIRRREREPNDHNGGDEPRVAAGAREEYPLVRLTIPPANLPLLYPSVQTVGWVIEKTTAERRSASERQLRGLRTRGTPRWAPKSGRPAR